MNAFQKLAKQQRKLEKKIREGGKEVLAEYFTDLFNSHPDLLAVRWHQYTPYFNDGDECVFSVCEPEFQILGLNSPYYEEDDGDVFLWVDFYGLFSSSSYTDEKPQELAADSVLKRKAAGWVEYKKVHPLFETCRKITKDLQSNENILKFACGDHSTVLVTRQGIEIEEYDHD